jgi:CIC family chloride channel protein
LLDKQLYSSQPVSLLGIWLTVRFISSASVIALAVPGGALGPCLILGALTGAVFNQLFHFPELQLFIVAGMGALLGAVLHVPLTGILFVLESTHEITLLIPCLITSYCAFYTHQRISRQNSLIELLLARQNVILRNSPSLRKKRLTSPL